MTTASAVFSNPCLAIAAKPSVLSRALFFLLFSGPPRLRERDPSASLRGEIDAVAIFHILVWVVAGLWVFCQLRFIFQEHAISAGLRLFQKMGLALVVALGLSTLVSFSPFLTAFIVYQLFISMMFTMLYVERYGVRAGFRSLFQSSAVLCVAIAVAFFAQPDLVADVTETNALRLRGYLLGGTEANAMICLLLLLAGIQRISKVTYGLILSLCCVLLVASLSRTAFVALFVVSLLALVKRPPSKAFRWFAVIIGLGTALVLLQGLESSTSRYRSPESIWTLSDRVGLWTYLSSVCLQKSPVFGLGYYAASRIYGPQYNADLGTAHSMFVETFVGGGFLALTALLVLCISMTVCALRVLGQNTTLSFTTATLFLVTMMFGFIGADFDSGSIAITFWSIAAILPILRRKDSGLAKRVVNFEERLMEVH